VNNRFSELFIRRPVATTLLTIGIAFAGLLAFGRLPVSPLPQVDFATINVQANMPGASPDNMASAVAAPLEKHLGQIADVTEMTSQSTLGNTRITLQFGLDRDINGAARDVQAAINAARGPADQPAAESELSQGQSRRRADHGARADLDHAAGRSALRRRFERTATEAVATRRHR
jgi:multidrug efflux pump subunit AcrB